jgi:hypothetical protein
MAMKGHIPGGGIASKQHVEKPVRTGDARKGIRPSWVAQKGQMVGDHATNKGQGTGYRGAEKFDGKTGVSVPLGNQVALNVKGGGPGTGRTLYGSSGSQGQHGTPDRGMPGLPSTRGQWPDRR